MSARVVSLHEGSRGYQRSRGAMTIINASSHSFLILPELRVSGASLFHNKYNIYILKKKEHIYSIYGTINHF